MTPMIRTVTKIGSLLASVSIAVLAQAQTITPSPDWVRAMPSAPVAGTKITGEYAALVGRDAYFWAWPLVNVYNRRLTYEKVQEIVMAGPVPAAPLNRLGMLSNYISPEERIVAPEPRRRLRCWFACSRPISGRDPSAGFRRSLLGLSDRRSAYRQLRCSR